MCDATGGDYPKYAVLENVPGMYSSGKGRDFLEVLNELCKIKDETLSVPLPESGRWSTAGEIVGDGFSLGWRTLDAQFFGVAQRRRRCFIVVDFTGERAGEILFDESRLRGDPSQGGFPWQKAAGCPADGVGSAIGCELGAATRLGGHCWDNLAGTLRADAGDNQAAVAYDARGNGNGETANTITGDHESRVTDYTSLAVIAFAQNQRDEDRDLQDRAGALAANPGAKQQTYVLQGSMIGRADENGPQGDGVNEDVSFTLTGQDRHGVAYAMTTGCFTQVYEEKAPTLQARDYKDAPAIARGAYVVRRLTPMECALLQGFPQDWCAGLETPDPTEEDIAFWSEVWETHRCLIGTSSKPKSRNQIVKWLQNPHTDSAEYMMWGNGVALPCVVFVLSGIVHYERKQAQLRP
jgi:DNA (cytosine-5)-methyltransferase 1